MKIVHHGHPIGRRTLTVGARGTRTVGVALASSAPAAAPRALSRDEQRALLRAAERAGARDRALVVLMLFAGLRIGETVALDVDDVTISARKGVVTIRSGKGDAYREIALNALVRAVLEESIKEREGRVPDGEPALFVSLKGTRISPRAADSAIRRVAGDGGLELSAHVLRHTCLTNLVRQGEDLVMVAEIAGHVRIETTRRYSLPSKADGQAAMERHGRRVLMAGWPARPSAAGSTASRSRSARRTSTSTSSSHLPTRASRSSTAATAASA